MLASSSARTVTLTPAPGLETAGAGLISQGRGRNSPQQLLDDLEVNLGERTDLLDRDRLVHLVDRAVHGTELRDLGTDVDDEAAIRRPTRAVDLGLHAGDFLHHRGERLHEPAALG